MICTAISYCTTCPGKGLLSCELWQFLLLLLLVYSYMYTKHRLLQKEGRDRQEATSPCTIDRSLVFNVPEVPPGIYTSLQRNSHLCIPRKGIAQA